jgi:hypothetical protein
LQQEQSVRKPRLNLITMSLLALVLFGYGVPLLNGALRARALRDPEALRFQLMREAEDTEAAFIYLQWVEVLQQRFPDEETRQFLMRRADHPRSLTRYIVAEALWRTYPAHPETAAVVRDYVADPRENYSLRNKMLSRNPDLRESELGREALAIIEAQKGFFPNREGIREYY